MAASFLRGARSGSEARRDRRTRFRSILCAALFALSCGPDSSSAVALPPTPPVVAVVMDEYAFSYDAQIPAGRVVFRFINDGHLAHRPALLPLSDDVPPILEQVRGTDRRSAPPFAGTPTREPGAIGKFAVDLAPDQRYALICFARDPDGDSHAQQGMVSEFRTPRINGRSESEVGGGK